MTENDVTGPHVTGSDPQVMSLPEVTWKGLLKAYKSSLGMFEVQQGCNSQEVVAT